MNKTMRSAFAAIAVLGAVTVGGIAQAAENVSICDLEPTSFEIWFIQLFYC